jgi:ATP-dependent DNA ligase
LALHAAITVSTLVSSRTVPSRWRADPRAAVPCVAEQELVIGGWTDPTGARNEFGALLVGHYDGDAFLYAGRVGTGFDE